MSSSPDGPLHATVDHYRVEIHTDTGISTSALFERVREQLFAYDVFPPRLIQAIICPPGRLAEGTTIV